MNNNSDILGQEEFSKSSIFFIEVTLYGLLVMYRSCFTHYTWNKVCLNLLHPNRRTS